MSSTDLTTQRIDPATVTGCGVDADTRNDPTYPLRTRHDIGGRTMDWARPPLQEPEVEVLRSVEHNRLPAVTGTSTPPSGLSGMLRRAAFRYSESNWAHWLMLLGADRINAVEGVIQDVAGGRFPNVPAEMGIRASWEHDRKRLVTQTVVVAGVSVLALWMLTRKDSRPRKVRKA